MSPFILHLIIKNFNTSILYFFCNCIEKKKIQLCLFEVITPYLTWWLVSKKKKSSLFRSLIIIRLNVLSLITSNRCLTIILAWKIKNYFLQKKKEKLLASIIIVIGWFGEKALIWEKNKGNTGRKKKRFTEKIREGQAAYANGQPGPNWTIITMILLAHVTEPIRMHHGTLLPNFYFLKTIFLNKNIWPCPDSARGGDDLVKYLVHCLVV